MKRLKLELLRVDGGTQPRAELDASAINQYAEDMSFGANFPPVTVFYDGNEYWLADGFHRYYASLKIESPTIECDIHKGTQRDAILHSVGANATHGMRRSNPDKRRAVMTLLQDEVWGKRSNNWIAKTCHVDEGTVRNHRDSIFGISEDAKREVRRGKSTYEQDTANIGKRIAVGDAEILRHAKDIKKERAQERLSDREEQRKEALLSNPILSGEKYRLFVSDIRELSIEPNSVDAIITDPPYALEYIGLYSTLSRLASNVLKDDGVCIVMTGQSYLDEVIKLLKEYLSYQWTLAYFTPGASVQVFGRKIKSNWKPLIFLTKGRNLWEHIDDVVVSDGRDKRYHEWGQSVEGMSKIAERFTVRGSVVLDPFCGAGATGVACLLNDRAFIGSDIEESEVKKTANRLEKL